MAQPDRPTPTNTINASGLVFGTDQNDQFNLAQADNTVYAGDGDDIAYGAQGVDILYGGNGNDYLFGSDGNNQIYGGYGDDSLYGGSGNDLFSGGPGTNYIFGGNGANTAIENELYHQATISTDSNGAENVVGPGGTDIMYQVGTLRFLDGSLSTDTGSSVAQAYRLYQASFGRAPDSAGLGYYTGQLDGGTALTAIAQQFLDSSEFATQYGASAAALGNSNFVSALYTNVLNRAASDDSSGAAYWKNQLDSGTLTKAQVLTDFSESSENVSNTASVFTASNTNPGVFAPSEAALQVLGAYRTVLGHLPDANGLAYYASQVEYNGVGLQDIAAQLLASPEFQNATATPAGAIGNADFAALIVTNAEGSAQAAAASYWADQLNTGAVTRAGLVQIYATAPEVQAAVAPQLQSGYAV